MRGKKESRKPPFAFIRIQVFLGKSQGYVWVLDRSSLPRSPISLVREARGPNPTLSSTTFPDLSLITYEYEYGVPVLYAGTWYTRIEPRIIGNKLTPNPSPNPNPSPTLPGRDDSARKRGMKNVIAKVYEC